VRADLNPYGRLKLDTSDRLDGLPTSSGWPVGAASITLVQCQ
jgi:hypothetical protein